MAGLAAAARRWGVAALLVAGLGGAALSTPPAAVDPDDYLLLGLRIGQLAPEQQVQGYSTARGTCLILSDIATALELAITVDNRAGTADGWYISEARRFRLDATGVAASDGRFSLEDGEVRHTPEGLCVDSAAFARWTGIGFELDLPNALVRVSSDEKLPVERSLERAQRRARFRAPVEASVEGLPRAAQPYGLFTAPAIDFNASLEAIDDKGRPEQRVSPQYELFAAGEVFRFSADARLASDRDGEPQSLRVRAYRAAADGGLLGPLDATMVALGDVTSFASQLVSEAFAGRGAYVTNRPLDQPQSFDRTDFYGEAPIGWDVELYRNGQLLAASDGRGDGRYAFTDVPLLYGVNRFEILLYGPQGQIRRERRTVSVGPETVAPGELRWWAGGLQEDKDLITLQEVEGRRPGHPWRFDVAADYGIDQKTTLSLQLHGQEQRDEQLTYVEGSLRRSVGPALVQLGAAADLDGGVAAQAALIGEFGRTYVTAEYSRAWDFVSDRIEPGLKSRARLEADHFFDLGRLQMPVALRIEHENWQARSDELDVAARISGNLPGLTLTGELEWRRFIAPGPDPPDTIDANLLVSSRAGAVRLRGEARFRVEPQSRFDTATLIADWPAGERGDWRAELGYEELYERARGGLGYAHRFDRFIVGASAEAATDGSVAGGLSLALSLGPDIDGRWGRVTARRQASSGTATARVFTDDNGDGRWEPGEALIPDVALSAGTAQVDQPTDGDGRTLIEGLRSFAPQLISIDSSTLPDPFLQPAVPGVVVEPRPGIALAVDLPLIRTGEVEGVLRGRDGTPRGGVALELLAMGTDRPAATTRSDFDGFFVLQGVRYGRYDLRIAPAVAERLRLDAPLRHGITVDAARPVARLGSVTIGGAMTTVAALPDFAVALALIDSDGRMPAFRDALEAVEAAEAAVIA